MACDITTAFSTRCLGETALNVDQRWMRCSSLEMVHLFGSTGDTLAGATVGTIKTAHSLGHEVGTAFAGESGARGPKGVRIHAGPATPNLGRAIARRNPCGSYSLQEPLSRTRYPPGVWRIRLAGISASSIISGVEPTEHRGRLMQSTDCDAARQREYVRRERIQSEHELKCAYGAALAFEHRLELAGLDGMAKQARIMRQRIAVAQGSWPPAETTRSREG